MSAPRTELQKQIGDYKKNNNVASTLSEKRNYLEEGFAEYQETRAAKIENFAKKIGLGDLEIEKAKTNPKYFREQFVEFIEGFNKLRGSTYHASDNELSNRPKDAAIKMKDLFGEQHTELYQLALEEEMNSSEYMTAVYEHSSETHKGKKWAERPIVIVSGPSASGKSHAANAAIREAKHFLRKTDDASENNVVVFVDGGKAREVSQMRKLAIIAANNKGYTGISDLHSKSKILGDVKKRIYNHVVNNTQHGIVIPDTFSSFIRPNDDSRKMLKEVLNLPQSRTIFTRVKGKDLSSFKKVVAVIGSSRAWKTKGLDQLQKLDLNAETIESKAYGSGGFKWGVLGSKLAEKWYKYNSKDNLSMIITNDLVLKKEVPTGSKNWVNAEPGDKGVTPVSERIFNMWLQRGNDNQDNLTTFIEKNKSKAPALIQTSSTIKIEHARAKLIEIGNNVRDPQLRQNLNSILNKLDLLKSLDEASLKNREILDENTKLISEKNKLIDEQNKLITANELKLKEIESNLEKPEYIGSKKTMMDEQINLSTKIIELIAAKHQLKYERDNLIAEKKQLKAIKSKYSAEKNELIGDLITSIDSLHSQQNHFTERNAFKYLENLNKALTKVKDEELRLPHAKEEKEPQIAPEKRSRSTTAMISRVIGNIFVPKVRHASAPPAIKVTNSNADDNKKYENEKKSNVQQQSEQEQTALSAPTSIRRPGNS